MTRLRELRKKRQLNQEGLAQRLNLSRSSISEFESGKRLPNLDTLITIANLFNVSLDYLIGLSDIKPPIGQPIKQSDLSPDELKYILKYRQATLIDREKIQAYVDGLLDK